MLDILVLPRRFHFTEDKAINIMSHGSPTGRSGRLNKWKMTELARAMRAARMAGVEIERFEVDATGKIGLVVAHGDESPKADDKDNPWESLKP
jgi:hypothetical protein